jgi:IS1 family transposase
MKIELSEEEVKWLYDFADDFEEYYHNWELRQYPYVSFDFWKLEKIINWLLVDRAEKIKKELLSVAMSKYNDDMMTDLHMTYENLINKINQIWTKQ